MSMSEAQLKAEARRQKILARGSDRLALAKGEKVLKLYVIYRIVI
jgi:hypothetical protein